jgi:hypothetical protein
MGILSSFPPRHRGLDTRTEVNLRQQQPRYIDANQLCPIPDIDFAAPIVRRAAVLYFRHQTDTEHGRQTNPRRRIRDCTHIAARTHAPAQHYPIILPLASERSRAKCPLSDIKLASPPRKAQRINMSDSLHEASMDRFVSWENIRRYRKLASETTNAAERSQIMKLLAEEETKFKLELSRSRDAPEGRSPVNAATENPCKHDGEEQQGGG